MAYMILASQIEDFIYPAAVLLLIRLSFIGPLKDSMMITE
jgi:multidrug efflux pump subunit AcrB